MAMGFERDLESVFVGGECGDEMFESDDFFGFFVEEVHGGVEVTISIGLINMLSNGLEREEQAPYHCL